MAIVNKLTGVPGKNDRHSIQKKVLEQLIGLNMDMDMLISVLKDINNPKQEKKNERFSNGADAS